MRFLASLGTILFVANGIFALVLNQNAWTKRPAAPAEQGSPSTRSYGSAAPWVKDYSQETTRHRRVRKALTWTFGILLLAIVLIFGIPLVITIVQLFI